MINKEGMPFKSIRKSTARSETAIKIVLATALLNLIAELVGLLSQLLKR